MRDPSRERSRSHYRLHRRDRLGHLQQIKGLIAGDHHNLAIDGEVCPSATPCSRVNLTASSLNSRLELRSLHCGPPIGGNILSRCPPSAKPAAGHIALFENPLIAPAAEDAGRCCARRQPRLKTRAEPQAQLNVGSPPAQSGFPLDAKVQLVVQRDAKSKANALAVGESL